MWLTRFQYTVAASGEREGLERCGSPGFNPQSPRSTTDFTGMYPVPATPRAYHPSFTRGIVQAILVVPQGRAIVNSKPYPACLFFWRGRPSTDAPGVQISILQRRLSVSSRKIWHPAPYAQPQAVWGGDFKFGVSGSASGRVPQKHIGCAVTRQQTTHRLAVG